MLACLDVAYVDDTAYAACVLFEEWRSERPVRVATRRMDNIAPYQPGAFYLRELPVLLAVLAEAGEPCSPIIVDGYVWLDALQQRPGLGARLHQALGEHTPIVGVAKTRFTNDTWSVEAFRGKSQRPLLVTAAGMEAEEAAACVSAMHGDNRIPTMLQRVDRQARDDALKHGR